MPSSSSSARSCVPCYEDPYSSSLASVDNVLQCQKLSDFMIAVAYFSIPLELFYFVTCASIFPFRWVLLQFGSFIVLCGLTHLLTFFTYSPHSFHLVLALTVLKFLTALVSIATAITLLTLIPQMLRVFVREGLLREKARELDKEVGIMKRQEEAGWHVRMLTREIRRSLDRHTILYTTLVELSKVLFLDRCAIWMPAAAVDDSLGGKRIVLTYELARQQRRRRLEDVRRTVGVRMDDLDVREVVGRKGIVMLGERSSLVCLNGEDEGLLDDVGRPRSVAIRMPLLRASNFHGGGVQELHETPFAILVLVLPIDNERVWTEEEVEIVEVVADQVAVALSHAAVLEDSMAVREQLMERNSMLLMERQKVEQANEARLLFQKVMSQEMSAPTRSVVALFSALQVEDLRKEQSALVKGGLVLSSLVGDSADSSRLGDGCLELKLRPFNLHSMVEEAANVSKLLCALRSVPFECRISAGIPKWVVGDEKRIFQAVLYIVGSLLATGDQGGILLHVSVEGVSNGSWKPSVFKDSVKLRFKIGRADCINVDSNVSRGMPSEEKSDHGPSHSICEKLAEAMQGSLSVTLTSQGTQGIMDFRIRVQEEKLSGEGIKPKHVYQETALILLRGMRILLGDSDGFNKAITKKVLERTGCELTTASSWHQCVEALYLKGNWFHILLIDLLILQEDQDVTVRIRKLRSESWLLVIALVPNADRDTKERCLQNGIHGVIRTPVILQEMIDEIQRVTQQLQVDLH